MTITGSYDTLMQQAPSTINTYFREAVKMVCDEFGDKFAEENSALIGALVSAMSQDFHTAVLCKTLSEVADVIQHKDFGGN